MTSLAQIVGKTQMFAADLAGEWEARDFARPIVWIVHDHLIAGTRRGVVTIDDTRIEQR